MTAIDLGGRPLGEKLFPLEYLLAATGLTRTRLRKLVKANGSDMAEAAREGCTLAQADSWALRAGFHPAEVWGDLWMAVPDDDMEGAA